MTAFRIELFHQNRVISQKCSELNIFMVMRSTEKPLYNLIRLGDLNVSKVLGPNYVLLFDNLKKKNYKGKNEIIYMLW